MIFFVPLDVAHTSRNIAIFILLQIANFGLTPKKFTLSLDNASYNNIAIEHIQNSLKLACTDVNDFSHVRCICYLFNLIVQRVFDNIREMTVKIRDVGILFLVL